MSKRATFHQSGFTLVELLIVIVIIGILAAITVLAYNGVTDRARVAVLQSDLANGRETLGVYRAQKGKFPADQPTAVTVGLKASAGDTLTYNASGDASIYCLQAAGWDMSYFVTNGNGTPQQGICDGTTGVPGGAPSGDGDSDGDGPHVNGGVVSTLAGNGDAFDLQEPGGVVVDSSGNVFVANYSSNAIDKIAPTGITSTFAGSSYSEGNDDGTGIAASFNHPWGLAIDSSNNLYVADEYNNCIRKITPAAVVTTFAGTCSSIAEGFDNGTGPAATFNHPEGVAVDGSGNVFVADMNNNAIRKITPAGVVTTFAGGGTNGASGLVNSTGTAARFNTPVDIAIVSGNLYVVDSGNNAIRKITSAGAVTSFAGSTSGASGFANASGSSALFNDPYGIVADSSGNLYVAEVSNCIRKITPSTAVTTFAGTCATDGSTYGFTDGTGAAASFNNPNGLAIDASGNIFVADTDNNAIRKMTPAGVVTTFAGDQYLQDGTGAAATFNEPSTATVDASGNIFVADAGNNAIRKITPAGVVTTFAGSTVYGTSNGTGTSARFYGPTGIVVDSSGNLYVTDAGNNCIRKISSSAVVTTIAGTCASNNTTFGFVNGSGAAAAFASPTGITIDASGNLYVTDSGSNCIRKITPSTAVTTFAGTCDSGFSTAGSADGTGAAAQFDNPSAITVDHSGNLYVADSNNNCIRKITPATVVTTFAGTCDSDGDTSGFDNGTGAAATFDGPYGLAFDSMGNLYVADVNNNAIRKVTPARVVTTLAGNGIAGLTDGTGAAATFNVPVGIAVNSSDDLYVVDAGNNAIRVIR